MRVATAGLDPVRHADTAQAGGACADYFTGVEGRFLMPFHANERAQIA